MKANEAPEKIYVHVKHGKVLNTWNIEWVGVNDIEYTQTNVFIEKACDWLKAHSPFVNDDILDVWLNNFKKYMKGE